MTTTNESNIDAASDYQRLHILGEQLEECRDAIAKIEEDVEHRRTIEQEILREMCSVADRLQTLKLPDPAGKWVISPAFKRSTKEEIDFDAIRVRYPAIYERCRPYVKGNIALRILEDQQGVDVTQKLLRDINPKMFIENSSVKIADFREQVTTAEKAQLRDEGIVQVTISYRGEPYLISAELASAVAGKRRKVAAGED